MDLAGLLKLFFEKASWLVGICLLGIAVALLRWAGYFGDADKNGVYLVYLVSAACGFVCMTGAVAALVEHLKEKLKKKKAHERLRKTAVENFATLEERYRNCIVWMYAFDRKTVSVSNVVDHLETLADQGFLDRQFPDDYHVIRWFTVPDDLWKKFDGIDREKLKRHLEEDRPPWSYSYRI